MKTWKALVGVVLIFAAGMMAGAAGTTIFVRHRIQKAVRGGPPALRAVVLKRLSVELRLTPVQQVEVDALLGQTQEKLQQLRKDYQPQMEAILGDSVEQMKPILTPAQAEKLKTLYENGRQNWRIGVQ